ncbi:MAG TPA: hypothetical protein EYG03_22010 [Planctomycetes bacterium]|nr:hypothetical protein [Fuerstiella sp.]HIK94629.1 hypothetical protein [Planctomycetota bacterium]
MSFLGIETSDDESLGINLRLINRVTIEQDEMGVMFLFAAFADGDTNNALTIRGTDDVNKEAILEIERVLNQHCE